MAQHKAYRRGKAVYITGKGIWWTFNSIDSAEAWKDWYNSRDEGDKEVIVGQQQGRVPVRLKWQEGDYTTYLRPGALLVNMGTDTDGTMLVQSCDEYIDALGAGTGKHEICGVYVGLRTQGELDYWPQERLDDLPETNLLTATAPDPSRTDNNARSLQECWMIVSGPVQLYIRDQYQEDPDPSNTWMITTYKPGQTNKAYSIGFPGGGAVGYNPNISTHDPSRHRKTKFSFMSASPWTTAWDRAICYFPGPFVIDM